MKPLACDVAIIGSGPAGLAAAYAAREAGARDVLVLERNWETGGILNQCIHNGFGVRLFGSDWTGPEYVSYWRRQAAESGARFYTRTMVLSLYQGPRLVAVNEREGLLEIDAGAVVLAMGCRERPRGALAIPGMRPAGVYTAGTAQRLVNIEGYMPGRRIVILGSGDIGMIMARRLTIEGADVAAMVEILPYISGLRRNLVQCVHDYDIPLSLCTTVIDVRGRERVESVVTAQVDEKRQPIPGTEEEVACDTLLLSVGLIPENELSRMAGVRLDPVTGGPLVDERYATSVEGIFAAGNVVHVYDLVDDVTESALRAGRYAAERALEGARAAVEPLPTQAGANVRHVVPQHLHPAWWQQVDQSEGPVLEFRAREPLEHAVRAVVRQGEAVVASRRFRYARPSEMMTVQLTPEQMARLAPGVAVTVDIVDV